MHQVTLKQHLGIEAAAIAADSLISQTAEYIVIEDITTTSQILIQVALTLLS